MLNHPELDWYYNQLKDCYLEPLEIGQHVKSFYLRKGATRLMSTLLIFSPEGIIITGDLRPNGSGGVVSLGYDLEWFSDQLSPDYLASKFLKEKWVKDRFIEWIKEYICAGIQDRSLDFERKTWRVGFNQINYPNYTEGRALRHLICQNMVDLDTAESAYESLPAYLKNGRWHCPYDSEFLDSGYSYDPAELGWLTAIQRRFSELVQDSKEVNNDQAKN